MIAEIKKLSVLGAAHEMALNYDAVPNSSEVNEFLEFYETSYTYGDYLNACEEYEGWSTGNIESEVFRIISKMADALRRHTREKKRTDRPV